MACAIHWVLDSTSPISCFGIGAPTTSLVCSVEAGATVTVRKLDSLCAHGAGTHLEVAGHVYGVPGHDSACKTQPCWSKYGGACASCGRVGAREDTPSAWPDRFVEASLRSARFVPTVSRLWPGLPSKHGCVVLDVSKSVELVGEGVHPEKYAGEILVRGDRVVTRRALEASVLPAFAFLAPAREPHPNVVSRDERPPAFAYAVVDKRAERHAGTEPLQRTKLVEQSATSAVFVIAGVAVQNHTKTNPAYFTDEAISFLIHVMDTLTTQKSISLSALLMTDLPSVDREDSGSDVRNHRRWFARFPHGGIVENVRSDWLHEDRTVVQRREHPNDPFSKEEARLVSAAMKSDRCTLELSYVEMDIDAVPLKVQVLGAD